MTQQKNPGNTPLIEIEGIYFKCEFENPTGSHKDRAFSLQAFKLKEQGITKAVISSSGNAAISAAHYCSLAGVELTVFVSPNINRNKLEILEGLNCKIIKTPRPVSGSIKYAGENGIYNLRQSTDPDAPAGYEPIAAEIVKKIAPDALFIPVSSATALMGIAAGFEKAGMKVPLHAVQTDNVHPIAGIFDKNFEKSGGKSLADAIVARYTPRENEAVACIKNTGGYGWVIGNSEMKEGRKWLLSHDIDCSFEGAATVAALWKAKKAGFKFNNPVCILTGKYYG